MVDLERKEQDIRVQCCYLYCFVAVCDDRDCLGGGTITLRKITKVVPYYEYFNPVACLGYSKLTIGFVKYTPPVYYNYKRKSTKGWSIWNIIFDLMGGIFSFASGSIEVGNGLNVTKLILAILTIVYDMIFIVQHYCIYPKSSEKKSFYLDEAATGDEAKQEPLA